MKVIFQPYKHRSVLVLQTTSQIQLVIIYIYSVKIMMYGISTSC